MKEIRVPTYSIPPSVQNNKTVKTWSSILNETGVYFQRQVFRRCKSRVLRFLTETSRRVSFDERALRFLHLDTNSFNILLIVERLDSLRIFFAWTRNSEWSWCRKCDSRGCRRVCTWKSCENPVRSCENEVLKHFVLICSFGAGGSAIFAGSKISFIYFMCFRSDVFVWYPSTSLMWCTEYVQVELNLAYSEPETKGKFQLRIFASFGNSN